MGDNAGLGSPENLPSPPTIDSADNCRNIAITPKSPSVATASGDFGAIACSQEVRSGLAIWAHPNVQFLP